MRLRIRPFDRRAAARRPFRLHVELSIPLQRAYSVQQVRHASERWLRRRREITVRIQSSNLLLQRARRGAGSVALLAAWLLLCPAPQLQAGGCHYRNGAEARSRAAGGAGSAWTDSALGGLMENPAALAKVASPRLDLNVTAAFASGDFQNRVDADGELDAGPFFVPEAAFAAPLGESGLVLGGGVSPAMMLAGDWEYEDVPGAAGDASYGRQRHFAEFLLLRSAAGAAYRVNPKLALGGNFGVVYNRNRLESPYIFQQQPTLAGLKTLLDLQTDGYAPDGCLGVLIDAAEGLRIGAVYRSKLDFTSRGQASGDVRAQFDALGIDAASTFAYDAEVNTRAPQAVTLGAAWTPAERFSLALQWEWLDWSAAMPDLPIFLTNGDNAAINGLLDSTSLNDRPLLEWSDRFVYRGGGEYGLSGRWFLRSGYSYSSPVAPDRTLTPLTADIVEHTLTSGVGYAGARHRLDLSYQWDRRKDRLVSDSALLGGEYDQTRLGVGIHWLTLGYSTSF